MRASEDYFSCPKEELQPACLAIYDREKAKGTELPAIIRLLRDHVEREEERLRMSNKMNMSNGAKRIESRGNSGFCRALIVNGDS
ncbi:hypothetical protein [Bradyrhizobium sp. USDA 3364]